MLPRYCIVADDTGADDTVVASLALLLCSFYRLFDQESFHVDDCPDDDVWPCKPPYKPEAGSTRDAALRELGERAVQGSDGGASRCGLSRVCWKQPNGSYGGGGASHRALSAAQCAAKLRCSGEDRTACVPALPEYADG